MQPHEPKMLYTKGEFVKYQAGGQTVKAVIKTRHTDGTVTVEAQHFLNEEGRIMQPYLGFKYRLPMSALRYCV